MKWVTGTFIGLVLAGLVFITLAGKPPKECPPCDPCPPCTSAGDTLIDYAEPLHASNGQILASLQLASGVYSVEVVIGESVGSIGNKTGAYLRNGSTVIPLAVAGGYNQPLITSTQTVGRMTIDGSQLLEVVADNIPGGGAGYNYKVRLAATPL